MNLKGIKLAFGYNGGTIFKDIDIDILEHGITTIIGPNGIGKSTLLRCLANIFKPSKGIVYLEGKAIGNLTERELAKRLGYVPQEQRGVFPITVYETILLGRKPYIRWSVTSKDIAIVDRIIDKLDLGIFAQRDINSLSGGERQKVAIARALAQEPALLFLDEPTASLDMRHQLEIMELVTELSVAKKSTVVMVLHDLNLAARYSNNIYLMGPQGIYANGAPHEVINSGNIKEIYGVEAEVTSTSRGLFVVPLKALEKGWQ